MARNRLDRLTKALPTYEVDPLLRPSITDARRILLYLPKLLDAPGMNWGNAWQPDTHPPAHRIDVYILLHSIALQVVRSELNWRTMHCCPWPRERVEDLETALEAFLDRSNKHEPRRPRPPRPPRPQRPSAPSLDAEIITTGYKVLASRLHPDRGGSEEKMKELNAAVERLRRMR